jgi:hypothetical protein
VADDRIDVGDPTAAVRSDDAASSMLVLLEKGNCNENGTKDIGIQV